MTEPDREASPAAESPTADDISARLEALLRRTHHLRAQRAQAESTGSSLGMTWPPPEKELNDYDVVDVPVDRLPVPHTPVTPAPHATAAGETPAAGAPPDGEATPPTDFSRPDWSELRLRPATPEPAARSTWWPVLAVCFGLLAAAEGGYIWYLSTQAPTATAGVLRIDAPGGLEVHVDGQAIGSTPLDHTLAPGEHLVEVSTADGARRSERVSIEAGRTVQLMTAAPAPEPTAPVPGPAADAEPAGPSAAATDDVSPTTGAVVIESTPAGLPVTMGGRPRGVTPLRVGQLKPGRHDVLVGGAARQVDVAAGEVATLHVVR